MRKAKKETVLASGVVYIEIYVRGIKDAPRFIVPVNVSKRIIRKAEKWRDKYAADADIKVSIYYSNGVSVLITGDAIVAPNDSIDITTVTLAALENCERRLINELGNLISEQRVNENIVRSAEWDRTLRDGIRRIEVQLDVIDNIKKEAFAIC